MASLYATLSKSNPAKAETCIISEDLGRWKLVSIQLAISKENKSCV